MHPESLDKSKTNLQEKGWRGCLMFMLHVTLFLQERKEFSVRRFFPLVVLGFGGVAWHLFQHSRVSDIRDGIFG